MTGFDGPGHFAAQLFRMAGADVMAADLSDYRLGKARACGIERTVNLIRDADPAIVPPA